ncbi:MAG: 8-oxo-dGTP diphosphatase [Candidatus Pacebacteria bacterium]|nr:8-oxo-dGTP diphosphatase [Candidatus Paceibacterota bacterium]
MRDSTLLFLIKKENNKAAEICLAMKKRGFGMGRWNGAGGKCNMGESVENATKRETLEEIGVNVLDMNKVAEITFMFENKPDWNQLVHVYVCEKWGGDPTESEEMRPQWFKIDEIPFKDMWPDDPFWLPQVLEGKKIKARFTFGEEDAILEQVVEVVS